MSVVVFAKSAYAALGQLDTTFNGAGVQPGTVATAVEDNPVERYFGRSVAIQSDGKVVVAGYTSASGQFAVARFNTDGTLDTSFNASGSQPGTVATKVNSEFAEGYAVAIQSDGKIVVAGYTKFSQKFAAARFTADGALDTTFNASGDQPGTIAVQIEGGAARAYAVAVQQDNKIVVAGYTVQGKEFAVARFNSNGTLDITFNNGGTQPGTAMTKVNNEFAYAYAVAIQTAALQADSKIIVAGYTDSNQFALARFNDDGTPDATFQGSSSQPGTVATTVNGGSARAYAVAIQSDGKILAAGETPGWRECAVARFNVDGTLDTEGFNTSGSQAGTTAVMINNESAYGRSVALQSDGKFVVAGYTSESGQFAVARFTAEGILDTEFNNSGAQPGTAVTQVDGGVALGYSMALQSDNKILIAGYTGGNSKFAVARFATSGKLDTTFNASGTQRGTVTTKINSVTASGYAVALQPNGALVLAGGVVIGNVRKFAVARFTASGTLDTTFNQFGVQAGTAAATIENVALDNEGHAVAIQQDGKIVVAGFANVSGANRFAVARFTASGTLDTTFNASGGQAGTVSTTIDTAAVDNRGYAVAVQSDGKIIVAGIANVSGANRFGVARFNTNGTLDTTFNVAGLQPGTVSTTIDGATVDNRGYAVAVQQDGKIVVAGVANVSGANRFGLARFNANGTPDTTFNASGLQAGTVSTTIDNVAVDNQGYAVAVQANGKIVVAGFTRSGEVNSFAVARFNANGILDTTFNSAGDQPGTVSTAIEGVAGNASAQAVVVRPDGEIVVAGSARVSDANRFAVAQFTANGTLDTTFNASGDEPGTVSTTINGVALNNRAFSVALQQDGKAAVGGTAFIDDFNRFAAARFYGSPSNNVTAPTTNVFALQLIAKYGPRLAAQR